MLYEIAKEIATSLSARGVPYPVVYGPESSPESVASSRIVIERDREQGDELGPPRTRTRRMTSAPVTSAIMVAHRALGAVIRVYGQSTVEGARVQDHERLVDHLVDRIQVALHEVITTRRTMWRPLRAKLLSGDELDLLGIRTWPGVVYELRLQIDRGVYATSWGGPGLPASPDGGQGTPTGTITGVVNRTDAQLDPAPVGVDPVPACGD